MSLIKYMSAMAAATLLVVTTGCGSKENQQAGEAAATEAQPQLTGEAAPGGSEGLEQMSLEEKLGVLEAAAEHPGTEVETFTGQVALLAASSDANAAGEDSRRRVARLVVLAELMLAHADGESAEGGPSESDDLASLGARASGGDPVAVSAYTLSGEVSRD